jgi:hypothetical protein
MIAWRGKGQPTSPMGRLGKLIKSTNFRLLLRNFALVSGQSLLFDGRRRAYDLMGLARPIVPRG